MPPPPPVFPEGYGPPDGGYGFVVAAAYALNNVIIIPILQNFGLVFRDVLVDLEISGTNIAVIMNLNNAFGLALGLFNGPILRTFSYRKVAMVGSGFVFFGMVLTAYASSFAEFLVYYGIVMSAGYNLTMASFAYAINTYFSKRRAMAMGFAMTLTGLGPVFMPLLISRAMKEFGPRYTALLLAALALHSTVGAFLLHPVRWHLVKLSKGDEDEAKEAAKEKEMADVSLSKADGLLEAVAEKEEGADKDGDAEDDVDTRAPMLTVRQRRLSGLSHRSGLARTASTDPTHTGPLGTTMWASMASIDSEALGGSMLTLNAGITDAAEDTANGHAGRNGVANGKAKEAAKSAKSAGPKGGILGAVVRFFDLDLLRDPVYVNIMLGLSFAVFAEMNFSLLTPFILADRHFGTQDIAYLLSIIAVSDIVFRFLAPFIKKACKQPVRVMYIMGLVMLITTRTVLIWCYSYDALIGVMVSLGVAKGLRTVYWVLVIPDYVPLERLPAANGLQSVTNGLIFMILGPGVGVIRDKLGDYNYVIMAINCLTALTIIMWGTEAVIRMTCAKGKKAADVERAASKS